MADKLPSAENRLGKGAVGVGTPPSTMVDSRSGGHSYTNVPHPGTPHWRAVRV
ncbi:MAG: hypothetical protein ACRERE_13925 [Candidatus Entotheonellia bacterium]